MNTKELYNAVFKKKPEALDRLTAERVLGLKADDTRNVWTPSLKLDDGEPICFGITGAENDSRFVWQPTLSPNHIEILIYLAIMPEDGLFVDREKSTRYNDLLADGLGYYASGGWGFIRLMHARPHEKLYLILLAVLSESELRSELDKILEEQK